MKRFLLLTMVLTSAGCATTATNVGAAARAAVSRLARRECTGGDDHRAR